MFNLKEERQRSVHRATSSDSIEEIDEMEDTGTIGRVSRNSDSMVHHALVKVVCEGLKTTTGRLLLRVTRFNTKVTIFSRPPSPCFPNFKTRAIYIKLIDLGSRSVTI